MDDFARKTEVKTVTPATETPAASTWKTQRLAALRRDLAAAKSDLSDFRIQQIEAWYERRTGEWPPETMAPDELAEMFLSAPAQWPRSWRQPTTITGIVQEELLRKDGSSVMMPVPTTRTVTPKTESEVNEVLNARFGSEPGITVQVIRLVYLGGVRGELLFLPGLKINDPRVVQEVHIGVYRVVAEGRCYAGSLAALGACPMPPDTRPGDPVYTSVHGVDGSHQIQTGVKSRPLRPRTVEVLIPEFSSETHARVLDYVERTNRYGESYWEQDYVWKPRRLAAVGA